MTKEEKIKKLNELMEFEFNVPNEDHIDYERLPANTKNQFRDDARLIITNELWKWLMFEMKKVCEKQIFERALDFDQVLGGKFMLHALDVLKKKLENIAK